MPAPAMGLGRLAPGAGRKAAAAHQSILGSGDARPGGHQAGCQGPGHAPGPWPPWGSQPRQGIRVLGGEAGYEQPEERRVASAAMGESLWWHGWWPGDLGIHGQWPGPATEAWACSPLHQGGLRQAEVWAGHGEYTNISCVFCVIPAE